MKIKHTDPHVYHVRRIKQFPYTVYYRYGRYQHGYNLYAIGASIPRVIGGLHETVKTMQTLQEYMNTHFPGRCSE